MAKVCDNHKADKPFRFTEQAVYPFRGQLPEHEASQEIAREQRNGASATSTCWVAVQT